MKWLALISVILLAVVAWNWMRRAPVAKLDGPIAAWILPDSWTVSVGTAGEKPVIVRTNVGLQAVLGHAAFPTRAGITVDFHEPTEDGFPPRKETAALDEIEEAIRSRFCAGNESVFAGVVTTGGTREFVLYTSHEAGAREKTEQLALDFRQHKLHFAFDADPEWKTYRQLLPR